MGKEWACYCLESQSGLTYVGATVDLDRRLNQHNGTLKGGARATKRSSGWKRICSVTGFPDERAALQFEWKWKFLSHRYPATSPVERRFGAVAQLLNETQSTSSATPFSDYPNPLFVFVEEDKHRHFLENKSFAFGILT